jgi:hypothetical protein
MQAVTAADMQHLVTLAELVDSAAEPVALAAAASMAAVPVASTVVADSTVAADIAKPHGGKQSNGCQIWQPLLL